MLGYWIFLQFLEGIPSIGSGGGGVIFKVQVAIFRLVLFTFLRMMNFINHKFYGWSKLEIFQKFGIIQTTKNED